MRKEVKKAAVLKVRHPELQIFFWEDIDGGAKSDQVFDTFYEAWDDAVKNGYQALDFT